jgi:hypothetical protein
VKGSAISPRSAKVTTASLELSAALPSPSDSTNRSNASGTARAKGFIDPD